MSRPTKTVGRRITIALEELSAHELAEIQDIDQAGTTESLRRAIRVYHWIRLEDIAGRKILSVNSAGRDVKELKVL
jgi:hypothetical protein